MAASQFIVGADGFDRYPAGTLSPLWPWQQINTNNLLAVVQGQSVFGSNALGVPAGSTNSCGWAFQTPSTMGFLRNAGLSGAFGFCGYIRIGNIATLGTDLLLAMSSSANINATMPLVGQSFSTAYGLNLAFPSQVVGLGKTNNPYLYAVKPGQWYWVGVYFSFQPTGKLIATYCINGKPIWTDVPVTWVTDILAGGQALDTVKVYNGTLAEWYLDDMIVHGVGSSNPSWPAPAVNTPEAVLPFFAPRQITLASASATATSHGFVSMNTSVPDYQSAVNTTGVAFLETDTAAQGSETYTWQTQPHANINAVVYRGISTNPSQVVAIQSVAGQQSNMRNSNSQAVGTGGFTGVSENDGTNPWTPASVAAASFGQTASA